MDLNDLIDYGKCIGIPLIALLVYYMIIMESNFESMKKLLEDNTTIELIKDTEKPTKDTSIIVRNDGFLSKSMSKGELGMAESYMDGDWTTHDLDKTLTELLINRETLINY